MVTRRVVGVAASCIVLAAALAYLRDPAWLIDVTSGLRPWEHRAGEPRYRWSTSHASFFVPAESGSFDMPVSTTFDDSDDRPMLVTVSVDDEVVARAVLTDASWTRIHVVLPPAGSRKVRRVDVRTSVTRADNHGVRIGELEFPPKLADKLLRLGSGGERAQTEELDRRRRVALRGVVERWTAALPFVTGVSRPAAGRHAADELADPPRRHG